MQQATCRVPGLNHILDQELNLAVAAIFLPELRVGQFKHLLGERAVHVREIHTQLLVSITKAALPAFSNDRGAPPVPTGSGHSPCKVQVHFHDDAGVDPWEHWLPNGPRWKRHGLVEVREPSANAPPEDLRLCRGFPWRGKGLVVQDQEHNEAIRRGKWMAAAASEYPLEIVLRGRRCCTCQSPRGRGCVASCLRNTHPTLSDNHIANVFAL